MRVSILWLLILADPVAANGPRAPWGDQGDGTYRNPVLWADYNNPDIIRSGDDFYMIAAAHHFMGMPVLHSRDMIHWRLIARIHRRLDIDPRYDRPAAGYKHGTWAPTITEHGGQFHVYVATPFEGVFVSRAQTPAGPWSPLEEFQRVKGWEDPCPFWDEDGQAYLIRGERGVPEPRKIYLHRMRPDGTALIDVNGNGDPTDDGVVVGSGPTLEGPKLLRRDGSYYIFAPEGGIEHGVQVVLRSDPRDGQPANIFGPYRKRVVLERGNTIVNGPHQGSWVELDDGSAWFYHFQQMQGYGRVLHLQPASWGDDGWPRMGSDPDGDGTGEPVLVHRKPALPPSPVEFPAASDGFDAPELALPWMWNHNPSDAHWSLTERPGFLRLRALPLSRVPGVPPTGPRIPFDGSILFARNTLVQMLTGRSSSATVEMRTGGLAPGQVAGLALFGREYLWIGVRKEDGGPGRLVARSVKAEHVGPSIGKRRRVYLRVEVEPGPRQPLGQASWRLDGEDWQELGEPTPLVRSWYEGTKLALFTWNERGEGHVDFARFDVEHDGPRAAREPEFTVELEKVREGIDPSVTWTQAGIGVIRDEKKPSFVVTLSPEKVSGSDSYGGLHECRSENLSTWSDPEAIPSLARIERDGLESVLSDFVPAWHGASKTLLGTGKLFIYDPRSRKSDREVARRIGYSVRDPDRGWSEPRSLLLPERDHEGLPLRNPNAGCTQRVDLEDGTILLPVYYERERTGADEVNVATVVRAGFDGETLRYLDQGSEHTIERGRGLGEPSLARYRGRFYLTLRSDHGAHVTSGKDGLHFDPPRDWKFDDGQLLGSYNTQQHWISREEGLYLVYTRRGHDNDHIFRHRAPLLIGRVDPDRLVVIRSSERVVVPEMGARLGNFSVARLDERTHLVCVAERLQRGGEAYGARNRVFVARLRWPAPGEVAPPE